MFKENSRYYDLPLRAHKDEKGRETTYVSRRFLVPSSDMTIAARHRMNAVDRIDNIAFAAYSDPTQFWRMADFALVFDPLELEQSGRDVALPMAGQPYILHDKKTGDER